MKQRGFGGSGISVPPLGMGCWAIGGPFWAGDQPLGWGQVDDGESVLAVRQAHAPECSPSWNGRAGPA